MPITARSTVRASSAALWSRRIGALAVPVLVLAALGHRAGAIPIEAIVPVLSAGISCGIFAAALAIFAFADIWVSGAQGFRHAVIGLVYAAPALLLVGVAGSGVVLYPRLTDISTDLIEVPEFTTIEPVDESEQDRSVQVAAYPEVIARFYPVTLDRAFTAVRTLVDDRGWTETHIEPPPAPMPVLPPAAATAAGPAATAGSAAEAPSEPTDLGEGESEPESAAPATAVVEAVARTLLFAFPDHVVVRMTETGEGTRIDMRSISEIGAHDLGQNARRIVRFMVDLDAVLQGMEDAEPAEDPASSGPAPVLPSPRPATP